MKKIIYILIAILTFSISLWLFNFRYYVVPVSLCKIKKNSHFYDKREVSVRGYLEVFELKNLENDDYVETISSFREGCIEDASLVYSDSLKNDSSLQKLRNELNEANRELLKTRFEAGWNLAEVEIVGEVDDLSDDGMTHCFVPDLSFKVKKIEQISPIIFVSREEVK